jgi:hypothetical protein
MAAHGGLAYGKDSNQKLHVMKQQAQRKLKVKKMKLKHKAVMPLAAKMQVNPT